MEERFRIGPAKKSTETQRKALRQNMDKLMWVSRVSLKRRGGTPFTLKGRLVLPQGMESVELVNEGFSFAVVEAFAEHMAITDTAVLETIGVTGGTVARRRKEEAIKPDESDRFYRLARVTAMAERVLEHPAKARTWLMSKNRALGGRTPFSLMRNEPGIAMVEDALNRIEYGVYG